MNPSALVDLLRRRQSDRWTAILRALDAGADPRSLMTDTERRILRDAIDHELARRGEPCTGERHHAYR